jgi:hypothetical protein
MMDAIEHGGAGEPGLLVHGEEELEGTVVDVVGLHDGEHGGDADAVVGAQGGSGP